MEPGLLFYKLILVLLLFSGASDACRAVLYVTTPGRLEALSGSCVQIPCNFIPNPYSSKPDEAFDVKKSVFEVWFKKHNFGPHPKQVIFNSSITDNAYPMIITGDLRQMDCTTLFSNLTTAYSDLYYFRIENRPYQATAVCNPLQMTVKDSPWSPSLEVSGNQTKTEVVTLTCSAVTPCPHAPPQLTWDLHQGTPHITETNPHGTLTTVIKLNLTLTDSHDGLMIKCSAVYPVSGGVNKTSDSNITLSVTYGPKDTSVRVSPSGALSPGQSVTLSCSSRAKPPVQNFTWFRHSSQGPVSVSEGDTYNFNLTEDGDFYCVASNGVGKELSPIIRLQISEDGTSFSFGAYNIVKLCVIILLYSSMVIFECWFRATYGKKPERRPEQTDANQVMGVSRRFPPGVSSAT